MNPALNRNFEHEARIRRVRAARGLPIDMPPIRWPWNRGGNVHVGALTTD